MRMKQIVVILLIVFNAFQTIKAQEANLVILNLKNGYSVKGEIVEQTSEGVKIKTINGEIFEYAADEIIGTETATLTSSYRVVSQTIAKGDMLLNIGLSFFSLPLKRSSQKMTFPLIPIAFEYVVKDDLFQRNGSVGVGGILGYTAFKYKSSFASFNSKNSRFIIGARGYAHYALVENLDTYAGLTLGYRSDVFKYESGPDQKNSDLFLQVFAGCRYFFTERIAGMAELGWGISIVTIGVSVKL